MLTRRRRVVTICQYSKDMLYRYSYSTSQWYIMSLLRKYCTVDYLFCKYCTVRYSGHYLVRKYCAVLTSVDSNYTLCNSMHHLLSNANNDAHFPPT